MIDGFKLTIPGTVIKGWLDAAHARHAEKAAGYKASLDNLPVNEQGCHLKPTRFGRVVQDLKYIGWR